MAIFEWVRFLAGAFLLLFGLVIFLIEIVGVFRFKYVLNRMHAAAMGDTLGIGFSLAGLILMSGFTFTSLKLFLIIVFLWFSSPASSHLIARLEVATDEEPEKHYRRRTLEELEREAAETAGADPAQAAAERESAVRKKPAEGASAAGKTPAERESDARKKPADGESAAGKTPAERESDARKRPAEGESAAGKTSAERKSAAGKTPAGRKSAAGKTPAGRKSAAQKKEA